MIYVLLYVSKGRALRINRKAPKQNLEPTYFDRRSYDPNKNQIKITLSRGAKKMLTGGIEPPTFTSPG